MKAAWTRKARKRLQEIHDYIAQDQPGNAKKFVERLIDKADLMAIVPDGGRIIPQYSRMNLRETFEGEYRIIYRVCEDGIEVITVRHMSRLLPKSIRRF